MELATTDDAQDLYFTSQLRLSIEAASIPEYRIFYFSPKGVELFAERGVMIPVNLGTISRSSGDGIVAPQVSGDGSFVGVTARNVCLKGGTN